MCWFEILEEGGGKERKLGKIKRGRGRFWRRFAVCGVIAHGGHNFLLVRSTTMSGSAPPPPPPPPPPPAAAISIAPRAVAEDVADWYLGPALDRTVPHSLNVKDRLRRALLVITRRILLDGPWDEVDAFVGGGGSGIGGSDALLAGGSGDLASGWRLYLDQENASIAVDGNGDDSKQELSRRSQARLRAFLSSCKWAVPDDPFPTPSGGGSAHGGGGGGSGGSGGAAAGAPPGGNASEVSVRDAEAAKTAAAADTAARQLLGKPLHAGDVAKAGGAAGVATGGGSSPSRHQPPLRGVRYPQFEADDLTVRVELYIRSLRRVRETGNECVLALEPPRAIKARVGGVVDSFVGTVGCVRSIGPQLRKLVGNLTKELLAVEAVGQDLLSAIGRMASEYEHQTSFASLAFLSTPEDAADAHLTPLLASYVQYLQADWENHVATCELESMLSRALDPDTRNLFKTVEFQSIGHLLDVCHQHRDALQNIMLPKAREEDIEEQVSDPKLVKQAMKDVRREKITVNGRSLPPAKTLKELIFVLTEALNSKPLTLSRGKKKRKSQRSKKQAAAAAAFREADSTTDESAVESSAVSESEVSSSTENETDGAASSSGGESGGRAQLTRRRSVIDTTTIEYMTRRILVAASRTGTGGDSYFVVRDLFGGEDVEVLPSSQGEGGSIELIVRLASVTIKCHGRYDVYPKPFDDRCEPLIQLHTATEETVSMHEVRSTDGHRTVLTLQEKMTDLTGTRSLSIRPALYEKVADWRTPS